MCAPAAGTGARSRLRPREKRAPGFPRGAAAAPVPAPAPQPALPERALHASARSLSLRVQDQSPANC